MKNKHGKVFMEAVKHSKKALKNAIIEAYVEGFRNAMSIVEKTNDVHIEEETKINGHYSIIKVGDQYRHRKWGTGMIEWINPNPQAKYPIKMHFKKLHVYCYFNVHGMQYDQQDLPLIEFPIAKIVHDSILLNKHLTKWFCYGIYTVTIWLGGTNAWYNKISKR